ncbi:MAG: hypothetical protein OXN86_03285 [Chloroflexota bacterium]|nr:hypothetical protein [Chloroflexota bacterium]
MEAAFEQGIERLNRHEEELEQQIRALRRQEADLETQVHKLGQREAELESQVKGLSEREAGLRRQEDELETQVLRLSEQEEMLEEQVKQIQQRETNLTQNVDFLLQRAAAAGDDDTERTKTIEQLQRMTEEQEQREAKLRDEHKELQRQLTLRGQDLDALKRERVKLSNDLKGEKQRSHSLRDRIRMLEAAHNAESSENPVAAHWSEREPADNFEDLITQARFMFGGLQIADSALQRASDLDSALEKERWLRDTWSALGALHEYAASDHEFAGDFFLWNTNSGSAYAWFPDRVAAQESAETMSRYGVKRAFEVDERVDPSGQIEMQAHLKIQKGGGQNIPRMFFYDDTAGSTGKVHIGFIGPHRLVPSANRS